MGSAARNLLIVEGVDDRYFVNQILLHHGFRKSSQADHEHYIIDREGSSEEEAVRILECKGFKKIPEALKAEFQPDALDGVAIIADMDLHSDRRWESLRGTLSRSHYFSGLPTWLPPEGLVHSQPGMPSLGVWLMPDNVSEGRMETFAGELVPAGDACWAHARATVDDLPDVVRRFSIERRRDNALLHTWLAWQNEPGCQTGLAVSMKLLQADLAPATNLAGWIQRWLVASTGRRAGEVDRTGNPS